MPTDQLSEQADTVATASFAKRNSGFEKAISETARKYRPDIDGLRAIAVLSVFIFHLDVNPFHYRVLSGGFVGVDIFFVISGYLISSLILADIATSGFSFLSFYKRRIVRIVPALLVMIFAVSCLSLLKLFPDELTNVAHSALASCFSYSNIYFFKRAGYFAESATRVLLLHTWSLGVEEQFYIVAPLLLLLLARCRQSVQKLVIAFVFVLSLAVSAYWAVHSPDAAFYLPQSRAWELLAGTALAMGIRPNLRKRGFREITALMGIAFIAYAVTRYDRTTPFPGLPALIPVFGAYAVISAGEAGPTLVGKALSLKPVVFIGLISYSLYLWHWPLLVFEGLGCLFHTRLSLTADRLSIVPVAFVMATLSWRFVERPFRATTSSLTRGHRALFALAGMGVVSVLALAILVARGFPQRFQPEAVRLASYVSRHDSSNPTRLGKCFVSASLAEFNQQQCLPDTPDRQTYLLIGDSHAAHFFPGLLSVYGDKYTIAQANATGCLPVLRDSAGSSVCAQMNRFVFDQYLPSHRISRVLISSRWRDESDISALSNTVQWLQARNIVATVIGPTPEFDAPLPIVLASAVNEGNPSEVEGHILQKSAVLNRRMAQAMKAIQASYIDAYSLLCPSQCTYTYKQSPVMFDTGHLTVAGSDFLVRQFRAKNLLPY